MASPKPNTYNAGSRSRIAGGRQLPPTWLESQPVGQWFALPSSTNLSTSPALFNWASQGGPLGEQKGIVTGWGGWAIDTVNSRIWVTGGGHSDYGGNEIYQIDIFSETPAWTRIVDPTPNAQQCHSAKFNNRPGSYAWSKWNLDGTPVAAHVYHNFHFLRATNRLHRSHFYSNTGQYVDGPLAFAPNNEAWLPGFNLSLNAWDAANTWGNIPNYVPTDPDSGGISYAPCCASDRYYYARLTAGGVNKVWRFDSLTGLWTGLPTELSVAAAGGDQWGYFGSLYDESRNQLVQIAEKVAKVGTYNLVTGALTEHTRTGPAAGFNLADTYIPAVRDTKRDLYYTYSGLASRDRNLYVIDPKNGYETTIYPATNVAALPDTHVNGMCSRMKYLPHLDLIVMQPVYYGPLYGIKLG